MLISHALLVPHLPTLMIDEHRGHVSGMVAALREASERLRAETPAAVVVLTSRWESPGPFLVDAGARHRTITDYAGFGVEVRYDCPGHPALARALVHAGAKAGLRAAAATRGADSGVAVPMYFLAPARDLAVVPISIASRPAAECRAWGAALRGALAAWRERLAFVVSGLLSNNMHAWLLRREVPEAGEFDRSTLEALEQGAWPRLGAHDERTLERAQPEAQLRHLEVLRGFLGEDARGEVRCYEASPGVGSALVEFAIPGAPADVAPA